MKILVADAFPLERLAELESLGLPVDHRPDLPARELAGAARDAAVLIVRSKQVGAEVFEAAQALSLVVRAGAGVNTIDVAAASRRGVYVANCPGQNSIAVAELAIGLLLSLDRRIPDNVSRLRAGKWDKKEFSEAAGLFGRTLGIVGLGSIGCEVVRRAQALGMRVVAWSRSLHDEGARALGVERAPDPMAVARAADYLSLHLALQSGHARDRVAGGAGRDEARGRPGQHGPGGAGGPGGAAGGRARRSHPRRHRRLRRRAGEGQGRLPERAGPASRASTAPTTSAPPPRRPRTPSPARPSASWPPSSARARSRTA